MAVDHGPNDVRCNAVAPGWIDMSFNAQFIEVEADPEAFRAGLARIHPFCRTGTPVGVARLICWLASDEAAFVTGQVWTIDGGDMSRLSLP